MSMSAVDLKNEIAERYKQANEIEKKYPDGLTPDANHEDYEQVKKLLTELDTMEDQLLPLEEAESRKARIQGNLDKWNKPVTQHNHPGDFNPNDWPVLKDAGLQFIESAEYRQVKESGVLGSTVKPAFGVPLEKGTRLIGQKAIVYSGTGVGGPLIQNDVRPGFLDILQRELNLLDLIPRTGTDSDTIEYVKEKTFTNNAAAVAEATATTGTSGLKPESVLEFETLTSPVRTVAHWIPVTNRMLADAPAIRGIINQRLLLGLDLKLESLIIDGDGTGENFTGILRTAGINIQGIGTDNAADAIFKGRTQVLVNGLARPNIVVLHPNDWQAIRLMRENAATGTLGGYLYGPPSVAGPMTIFGLPVVESMGAVENTALVGDFNMGCTLFDREAAAVRTGLIDDQFVRNMQTILAELRAAFVVWRPTAFAKVTGI